MDKMETIGLAAVEQRNDLVLRAMFIDAYALAAPHLTDDGQWHTLADEMLAYDALATRFPDMIGVQLMATLATIAHVRASGRTPT